MIFTINDGDFVAKIDTVGAQVVSVKANGTERLWQNDDGSWAGHAPVLFPVCGRTKTTVDGVVYPLPMHGFAKRSEFVGEQIDAQTAQFSLRSDAETKQMYPFDWLLKLVYRVHDNTLEVSVEVKNLGKKDMYFSLGGHESYALTGNFADYELRFPCEETFETCLHDNTGMLTGEKLKLAPDGKILPLPYEFMREGTTVILHNIRSRSVELCDKNGATLARSRFDGFSNLLLWHPDGSKMVCIEPWLNLPDFAANGATELSAKEGFVRLAPDCMRQFVRKITYM